MKNYIRLPLENTTNTRDLGGYACNGGGVTRFRAFVRSDALNRLSDNDILFLKEYGIRTVIDLRSPAEANNHPCPDAVKAFADYVNISIIPGDLEVDMADLLKVPPERQMPNLYLSILKESQKSFALVIKTAAEAREGGVLFHCAVGKDRTGTVAALLLGTVGVSVDDIISNYEVTHTYIRRSPHFLEGVQKLPIGYWQSNREYIEPALSYLSEYESAAGYIESIGLKEDIISKIRKRFVEF